MLINPTADQIRQWKQKVTKSKDMKLQKSKSNPLKPKFPKIHIEKGKDVICAYTDGAVQGNGKAVNIGGYGFLLVEKDKVLHQYTRRVDNTTNNKMELQGIIDCLEYVEDNRIYESQIILHSDSQYCIHGISTWMHNWYKRGWTDVKNVDQWRHLYNLVNLLPNVQYKWVRGHQVDSSPETRYNCMIDELIQECMFGEKKPDIQKGAAPVDAKTFLLDRYLPTTSHDERELWYKCSDWARQIVTIMEEYRNQ